MKERINVNEMVRLFLKERGYDGLCAVICGCGLDDLFPCGYCCENDCVAAYRYAFVQDPLHDCPEYEECSKSETGCISEVLDTNTDVIVYRESELFFIGIKRDCRCRRPYANQEGDDNA
jgi:hypothetical protein